MVPCRAVLVFVTATLLAVIPLSAQSLDAARAGFVLPARELRMAPDIARGLDQANARAKPRWPFVVGGAVVGGAVAGAWMANSIRKTDDAMVFPQYVVAILGVGVGVGALAGWVVAEAVR